jgi:hypothetical protein
MVAVALLLLLLQNNGVISLTGVASRWAGWGASAWLLLFGVVGKFGGLVLSIPDCVLGGATSFLFSAGKQDSNTRFFGFGVQGSGLTVRFLSPVVRPGSTPDCAVMLAYWE